jgi:hypothetical protein
MNFTKTSNISSNLLGYIITKIDNNTVDVISIYKFDTIFFHNGVKYTMRMDNTNIILSPILSPILSYENELVKQHAIISLDIEKKYKYINLLVLKACTKHESKSIIDELSDCCKVIQKQLVHLKNIDLVFTLRPGISTIIYNNITVTWRPYETDESVNNISSYEYSYFD